MPILFQPLKRAAREYAREDEELFRREVENYLLQLSSGVNGAASAMGTEASLASKREIFLSPGVSVSTI